MKLIIFLLRLAMGWIMLYAGVVKIINPQWTSQGYLLAAKSFSGFYQWLAAPEMLFIIDLLNEWGLTLLGLSLLLGLGVRLSSSLGAVLMLLYYLPALDFPYAGGGNYFLIDYHVIYALVLVLLAVGRAGRWLGLDSYLPKNHWLG